MENNVDHKLNIEWMVPIIQKLNSKRFIIISGKESEMVKKKSTFNYQEKRDYCWIMMVIFSLDRHGSNTM